MTAEKMLDEKMLDETGIVNYPEREIILQAMKEFAKIKCKEQRNACANWIENNAVLECPLVTDESTS